MKPLRTLILIVIILTTALLTPPARGRDFSWDGHFSTIWDRQSSSDRTNWDPQQINNPIPDSNDNVFFGDIAADTYTVDLNGSRTVLSATFSGSNNYALIGSVNTDKLTLSTGVLTAGGGGTHTISSQVGLGADGLWTLWGTQLEVSGRISASAYRLNTTGAGTLTLSGGGAVEPSLLWSLKSESGTVVLDGAHLTLTGADTAVEYVLRAQTGNITLQNGAVLQMGTDGLGYVEDGTLTITGSSSLYGRQLDAGDLGTTGNVVVEHGALLDISKYLWVGISSDGDLKVRSGATATTSHFALGVKTTTSGPALGTALVTGTSSLLSASSLNLGGNSASMLGGTGALTVEDGGAVQVSSETKFWTGASSITVNGGTFETNRLNNHTSVAATVSISDPTGAAALTVGTNNGNSTFDGLIQDAGGGAGSLNKVGTGTLILTGANTYTGDTIIVGGSIIVGHANALGDSTVYINVNDGLDVTTNSIDATIGALAGVANLNLGSQKLITGGNGADTTYSGVISGDSNSILRHKGAGTLTLTGTGSNFGSLKAVSSGTVVLDGFNATLTESTNINALTAVNGALTVSNGSKITLTSSDVTATSNGTVTVTGSGTRVTSGRSIYAVFGGEFIVDDFADVTAYAAYIGAYQTSTGSGTLTVGSRGSLGIYNDTVLGEYIGDVGDVTVTGAVSSFSTGSLKLGGSDSSNLGGVGTLTVEDGATVLVTDEIKFWTSASSITVNGGSLQTKRLNNHTDVVATVSISDPDAKTPALTVGINDGSSTFSGVIQNAAGGAGSLKKIGTGTLTLTGANTYTGETIIAGGSIIVGHANALGDSTVYINVNDGLDVTTNSIDATIGALAGGGNLNLGSQTLVTGGNGADTTYSGAISGTSDSTLRYNGAGTLTLTGAGSNFGFLRANGSGTLVLDDFDATLTKGSDYDALSVLNGELNVSNGSTINTTSQDVTAWTNGTLTVTGAGTQVTSGRDIYAIFGGEISVEDFADVTGNEAYIGARQDTTGSGTLTVSSGGSVGISGNTYVGEASGDVGDLTVTDAGSSFSTGDLKLGGYDTSEFGGTANVSVDDGGLLTVDGTTTFFTSASNMTINGGTFETDQLTNETGVVATVSISDPTGGVALTVGTNDGDSTFDGLIQDVPSGDPGSLKKVGTGTFTLTGANTYSGGTIIEAGGALLAGNTTGSATGTGAVQVNSGGTLGGTGSVAGAVTVASGGTLAPGASPGTLSLDGGLAFESGSILAIEIGGLVQGDDYDFLDVAGDVTLNGALDVTLIDPFTPSFAQTFDILDWGTLGGTFNMINLPGLDPGLVWETTDLYNTGEISVTGLLGDANNDSVVSADDYGSVQLNFGDVGDINILGDANLDGVVSADDYGSVQLHFGEMAGLGGATVPEPASAGLLLLGFSGSLRRRMKR